MILVAEPNLAKDLKDNVEPRVLKLQMLSAEPRRVKDRIEKDDPKAT
jgi:hypothetical protein